MLARSRWSPVAIVCATLGLSCGGGGDEPPVAMHFDPGSLVASFRQGDVTPYISVAVTLSKPLSGPIYVSIEESEPVLDASQTLIVAGGNGSSATVVVYPSCALAPGVHSGAVTVALCADKACANRYALSGNALPYTFTVSPGLIVTAKVDGVAQPGFATLCGVGGGNFGWRVTVGHTVELASTLPVSWSYGLSGGTSFPAVTGESTTATSWTGTIVENSPYGSPPPNTVFGYVDVNAADDPYRWVSVSIAVATP